MVTVSFDPTLIPKPKSRRQGEGQPAAKPGQPLEIPANPFAPDPNDPKYLAEQKEAKEKAEREQKDYDKKIADGKKRVDGADRPVRGLVLRDSGRQLPLDQP